MDKTGRALGTLNPVIYFENKDGHVMLAPEEVGHGPVMARRLYEERYRKQGYEWKEAGTLNDVDILQDRLVRQEQRIAERQGHVVDQQREHIWKTTARNLRTRMESSSCTAYEREFIGLYLDMHEEKRKKYNQEYTNRSWYMWAREQDSGTKVEDRMGSDE